MDTLKVIDGIPVRLRGVRKGAKSIVKFVQRCCHCGLEHDVEISHNGKNPDVDIAFKQKGE